MGRSGGLNSLGDREEDESRDQVREGGTGPPMGQSSGPLSEPGRRSTEASGGAIPPSLAFSEKIMPLVFFFSFPQVDPKMGKRQKNLFPVATLPLTLKHCIKDNCGSEKNPFIPLRDWTVRPGEMNLFPFQFGDPDRQN